MIELQQTWYHIEEKIKKSDVKIMRQVADFYIDQQYLEIDFLDKEFVELKVLGRNVNREIGFIADDENQKVIVNLGDLESWPTTIWPINNDKLRHVKLEIQYVLTNPKFRRNNKGNMFTKVFNFFFRRKKLSLGPSGYESNYKFNGPIQPEFSITVPKGMKMKDNGKNLIMLLTEKVDDVVIHEIDVNGSIIFSEFPGVIRNSEKIYEFENDGLIHTIIKNDSNFILTSQLRVREEPLFFNDPYITKKNGKEVYNFLIDGNSYKKIIENSDHKLIEEHLFFNYPHFKKNGDAYNFLIDGNNYKKNIENNQTEIEIDFAVDNDDFFYFFPLFAIGLLGISLVSLVSSITQKTDLSLINSTSNQTSILIQYSPTHELPLAFIIILLSFITLFFTLSFKENYEIPHITFTYIVIGVSIVLFLICLFFIL